MQNKETEVDSSVQVSINLKIEDLKQAATTLANRLEQEKHKNVSLLLSLARTWTHYQAH